MAVVSQTDVEAFLADGPPPVVVTLGTSGASARPEVFEQVAVVLDELGERGLFLTSNAAITERVRSGGCRATPRHLAVRSLGPPAAPLPRARPVGRARHERARAGGRGAVGDRAVHVRSAVARPPSGRARHRHLGSARPRPCRARCGGCCPTARSASGPASSARRSPPTMASRRRATRSKRSSPAADVTDPPHRPPIGSLLAAGHDVSGNETESAVDDVSEQRSGGERPPSALHGAGRGGACPMASSRPSQSATVTVNAECGLAR